SFERPVETDGVASARRAPGVHVVGTRTLVLADGTMPRLVVAPDGGPPQTLSWTRDERRREVRAGAPAEIVVAVDGRDARDDAYLVEAWRGEESIGAGAAAVRGVPSLSLHADDASVVHLRPLRAAPTRVVLAFVCDAGRVVVAEST